MMATPPLHSSPSVYLDSNRDGSSRRYSPNDDSITRTLVRSMSQMTLATRDMCKICKTKPRFSANGKSYTTCGAKCHAVLQRRSSACRDTTPLSPSPSLRRTVSSASISRPQDPQIRSSVSLRKSVLDRSISTSRHQDDELVRKPLCVVCKLRSARGDYVTCSVSCIEKLIIEGGDNTMCNYCHMSSKVPGKAQCGSRCAEKARNACLLCKTRPTSGPTYQLCGNTCKEISMKYSPLILRAYGEHKTFEMVETLFRKAWKSSETMPRVRRVFKIVEGEILRAPYDAYKSKIGNERFCYHGTTRQCGLGTTTNALCNFLSCPLCNILKTSFKVNLADRGGAFGQGIYTSTTSNKYTDESKKAKASHRINGVVILTKVVLGKVHTVSNFGEVSGCPPGYDSVVFDRHKGVRNETVVYRNDAIRPVFLITF